MKGRVGFFVDDRDRQCTSKKGFATKAKAKLHLRRSRRFNDRDNVKPYRCPWCGVWHLGHKAGTNKPADTG